MRREGIYTGRLRQELCWHVLRILVGELCSQQPGGCARAGASLARLEDAAQKLIDHPFKALTADQQQQVQAWIARMAALRTASQADECQ